MKQVPGKFKFERLKCEGFRPKLFGLVSGLYKAQTLKGLRYVSAHENQIPVTRVRTNEKKKP